MCADVPEIIGKFSLNYRHKQAYYTIFKLTCTSTGGPLTYATWTRDGTDVLTGDFVPHQVIVDTMGNILQHSDNDRKT